MELTVCPNCDSRLTLRIEETGRSYHCFKCGSIHSPRVIPIQSPNEISGKRPHDDARENAPAKRWGKQEKTTSPNSSVAGGTICGECREWTPCKKTTVMYVRGFLMTIWYGQVDTYLCRRCFNRVFVEFTFSTIFLGWWSLLSIFVTPIVLANNVRQYIAFHMVEYDQCQIGSYHYLAIAAFGLSLAIVIIAIVGAGVFLWTNVSRW